MTRVLKSNFAKTIMATIAVGAMMMFGLVLAPVAAAHENNLDSTIDDLVALAIVDSVLNDGFTTGDKDGAFSNAFDDIVALAIIDQVLDNGNGNGVLSGTDNTIDDLVALAIIDSVLNDDRTGNGVSAVFDDIVALAIIDRVLGNGVDVGF